jgi:hypothetical protein
MKAPLSKITITWDDENRPEIAVDYQQAETQAEAETETGVEIDDTEAPRADAGEWLKALAERLSDKSARFLSTLVTMTADDGYVSLGELATQLDVARADVDGWNRNLGRSINAVTREHGHLRPETDDGTAQVFDWKPSDDGWVYRVPAEFRQVLKDALDGR